ncbi:MAG TPA: hypothetical protein VGH43_10220 [Jatrophihabitans sp.]|jgi:hypothetical protein
MRPTAVDATPPAGAAVEPVRSAAALGRALRTKAAGGIWALTIAAVVYSQFNIYGKLSRDSAIYVYGGQRFVHGAPPYVSIMDPKGPLSSILCGVGVAVARLFGRSDLLVIRVEFCALAILGVLGVYLLVVELWQSVVGGLVAAAVFVTFSRFAHQALAGPDGHSPGTVFLIFALWLTARKNWYLGGVAAGLAFVSWQPLFPYVPISLLCAVAWSPGRRRHAAAWNLAGAATPVILLMGYYAAEGHLGKLFEGLFVFPLTGTRRAPLSFGARLQFMFRNVAGSYGAGAVLLWIGLALVLAAAVWIVVRSQWRAALLHPLVLLVGLSLVTQLAYMAYDYIGWTHAFPVLPYAAAGFGMAGAKLLHRLSGVRAQQAATAGLLIGVTALVTTCAVLYYQPSDDEPLRSEQASACAIAGALVPGTPLWTLGDPVPLVLLHRSNPDNYPYLGSGEDVWKVKHTRGGFDGWTDQIAASGATVIVMDTWRGPYRGPMHDWLVTHGYQLGYIGPFRVYVTRAARVQMGVESIPRARHKEQWPLTTTGGTFRDTGCTHIEAG